MKNIDRQAGLFIAVVTNSGSTSLSDIWFGCKVQHLCMRTENATAFWVTLVKLPSDSLHPDLDLI